MINRFLSKKLSSFQIICMGFVGAILLLIWMCRDGDRGPNAYGPDPKDPGAGWPESGRDPWEY